jgi:carboxypeptidase PM20D1
MVPSVEEPVAFVGVAEKGYMSLELSVTAKGGHSSRPPAQTAIGILGAAIVSLEENPMPARLGKVTSMTMDTLAPEMDIGPRTLLANRWLFGRGIEYAMGRVPEAAPMVRTTTAATIIKAGTKDNVLPIRAAAVVNFRLAPEDTPDAVIAHVQAVIDDDRVDVKPVEAPRPASEPSVVGNEAWKLLARTIREMHPDTIVTPYLVIGGTDARHYQGLSDSVYRFKAGRVDTETLDRVHGTDERLSIEDYADTIGFYVRLIENAAAPDATLTAG